jgi:Peroxiredoxin
MAKVAIGKKVPDFSLPATGGTTWSLADAAGSKLVIYFYPKDMTSGCTREAQAFRDLYPAFRRARVQIVGISRDSIASHEKFREKERLPFPLLSDERKRSAGCSTSSGRRPSTAAATWASSAARSCSMPKACSGASGAR